MDDSHFSIDVPVGHAASDGRLSSLWVNPVEPAIGSYRIQISLELHDSTSPPEPSSSG